MNGTLQRGVTVSKLGLLDELRTSMEFEFVFGVMDIGLE